MKNFTRTLCVGVLAFAAFAIPHAEAERIGGPTTDSAIVQPGQSVYYNVPFAAGTQAIVSIISQGPPTVELYLYDADGHVTQGIGRFGRRVATMDVYRTGTFRVEVRNLGTVATPVVLATN